MPINHPTFVRMKTVREDFRANEITIADIRAIEVYDPDDRRAKTARILLNHPISRMFRGYATMTQHERNVLGLTHEDTHFTTRATALFAYPKKMRCPGFNMPAGPPEYGGTCLAAAMGSADDSKAWVCHDCYTLGAGKSYSYAPSIISSTIRYVWAKHAVADGSFVPIMTGSIQRTAARLHTMNRRAKFNGNYFRIHDSGDFHGIDGYYEAWCAVAEAIPSVQFWAPTRDWIMPKLADRFLRRPPPPNLTIRPSAVRINLAPPVVPGLAAGSSVSYVQHDKVLQCPAFEAESEHTCESANGGHGCRVCWDEPDRAVNYHPHEIRSKVSKAKRAEAQVWRRNRSIPKAPPGCALDDVDLADLYHAWREERNGPDDFEVYLVRNGFNPGCFEDYQWCKFLRESMGADEEEQIEYIESLSGWFTD